MEAINGLLTDGTCSSTNGHHARYRTVASFTSPDYEVSINIPSGNAILAYYHLTLLARVQDANNFYFANIEFGNQIYFGRVVNGSADYYDISSATGLQARHVGLRVDGTSISKKLLVTKKKPSMTVLSRRRGMPLWNGKSLN